MNIDEALRACETVVREHSSTFYIGSALLPAQQRLAVRVVYAACRLGDDAVDLAAGPNQGRERLEDWWQRVDRAYAGSPRYEDPLELGLSWVLERFEVPEPAFHELHLGLASDLERSDVATLDELLLYCRRVAGIVGWLIAPICGYHGGEGTLSDALALGQAMQLTNILRDVGEDLAMGRCYLPKDMMTRHGVDTYDLRSGKVTDEYIALLKELMGMARRSYHIGWRSIPQLKGRSALAIGVAALSYERILTKLECNGYDNLTRRAFLTLAERFALVPTAAVEVYSRRPARHVRHPA